MKKLLCLISLLALRAVAVAQQEQGLIAHWRFAPDRMLGDKIKPAFGGPDVTFKGPVRFVADPAPPRAELPGQSENLVVAADLTEAMLPQREMSAETWVRVDRTADWGAMFSVIQDNGDFERGWILGFRDANFCFGLTTTNHPRLTYLNAAARFETNRWYHVVGTYDGTNQNIYVDGRLAGTSTEQAGPILYPAHAPVAIGAYHDDDEHYRLVGAIHEVRLFRRALPADEIAARFQRRKAEFPEPAPPPKLFTLAYGPFVDWRSRTSAVVTWETDLPVPTRLDLEAPDGRVTPLQQDGTRTRHEVVLTDLKPDREYHYRIVAPPEAGKPVQSKRYTFDTSFYYEPVVATAAATPDDTATVAGELLRNSGARDGYALVLGAVDGRLALELARQSRMDIVVVDNDPARVAAARATLDATGLYGVRVSVHLADNARLPYGDFLANLITSETTLATGEPPFINAAEVHRLTRPNGGTAAFRSLPAKASNAALRARWQQWLAGSPLASSPVAPSGPLDLRFTRGRLAGAGEWSHQYGNTDNSSCSQDELVQGELQVAWWGDPGPRPMPDRGNRNPAPLSVDGRLFVQGNRILFGLDAYNGAILWTLSAPEVRRANVTRDCSNMAAATNRLYVAHGRYCVVIDGQTGARTRRFEVIEDTPAGAFDWGYVAAANDWLIGSRQKHDAAYLGDDGEWYEDFATEQTSRVTSDRLFSLDPVDGRQRWVYRGGVILNSTITIADGMLLLLESRNPAALAASTSRLPHEMLSDQYLVALDLRTGKRLWDKGHDFSQLQYMTYLVYGQGTAVITGTDRNKVYHTFAFSAPSPTRPGGDDLEGGVGGRLLWSDSHKEDKGHHSGHLQHPLVIGSQFYSDQRSFDLISGKLLRTDLPERRGCGIMSAGKNAVFFRHHFHAMWDLASNKRTQFEGIRTGCWLGMVPAGGMLLVPESSAGCSCTHAIQTSVGYVPKAILQKP